jgi:hypothetical protein
MIFKVIQLLGIFLISIAIPVIISRLTKKQPVEPSINAVFAIGMTMIFIKLLL